MKIFERKITCVGDELGITLPEDVLKEWGVTEGDRVSLLLEGDKIVIVPSKSMIDGIDPDFLDMVENTFNRYEQTLKGLSKR